MKDSSEKEDAQERERAKLRALALDRLRQKILSCPWDAQQAGAQVASRIREWMRDANAKKARRMQEDIELLGIARALVLDEKEWRSLSTTTAVDLLDGDELSRLGLPTGMLPKWMVSVFEKTGALEYRLTFRVEEYFLDWLRHARDYGVDLPRLSAVEAFAQARIARMKELGEPFDEAEIRGEYAPDRFNSALAQPCYALSMVLSEMMESGVDPATDAPTWWEVAVAVVLALDPMADPRPIGLGLLPTWGASDEESTFNAREAIPIYIPDRARRSEEGDDRLWELVARTEAVLYTDAVHDLSTPLPGDPSLVVAPQDELTALEKVVRERIHGSRVSRVLKVLRLLFFHGEEFIAASALDGMGLPAKSVFSAATGWGQDRRGGRGKALFYGKSRLVEYVSKEWTPKGDRSDPSDPSEPTV